MLLSMTACGTQTTTPPATQSVTQPGNPAQIESATQPVQESVAAAINYKDMKDTSIKIEPIELTDEWDKVFPLSEEVNHRKVTFANHFGITLAADLYEPKEYTGKLPAIAVCGPFGAVKEQSSGLYAQEMAKRGFLAIAFDPSFTGESAGYQEILIPPTSILRITRPRLTSSLHRKMSIRKKSGSSVSADGAAWPYRQRALTPESRQPQP